MTIAFLAAGEGENWLAIFRQRFRSTEIISNAVVNIVSILLLVATVDRETFHGQKRRDRRDSDLHAVLPSAGHRAIYGKHLVEAKREVGSVCTLHREIVDEHGFVLLNLGIARHQKINDDVDRQAAVFGIHLAHKLKLFQFLTSSKRCRSTLWPLVHDPLMVWGEQAKRLWRRRAQRPPSLHGPMEISAV